MVNALLRFAVGSGSNYHAIVRWNGVSSPITPHVSLAVVRKFCEFLSTELAYRRFFFNGSCLVLPQSARCIRWFFSLLIPHYGRVYNDYLTYFVLRETKVFVPHEFLSSADVAAA